MLFVACVVLAAVAARASAWTPTFSHFAEDDVAQFKSVDADPPEHVQHKARLAFLQGRAGDALTVEAGQSRPHKRRSPYAQRVLNAELAAAQRAYNDAHALGSAIKLDTSLPASVAVAWDLPSTFDRRDEEAQRDILSVVAKATGAYSDDDDDDDDAAKQKQSCRIFCDELYAITADSSYGTTLSLNVISKRTGRVLAEIGKLRPREGQVRVSGEAYAAAMNPKTGEIYVMVQDEGLAVVMVDPCTAEYTTSFSSEAISATDATFDSNGRFYVAQSRAGKAELFVATDVLEGEFEATTLQDVPVSGSSVLLTTLLGKHGSSDDEAIIGNEFKLYDFNLADAVTTSQPRPALLSLGDSLTADLDGTLFSAKRGAVEDRGSFINIIDRETNKLTRLSLVRYDVRALVAPVAEVCQDIGDRKTKHTLFPDHADDFNAKLEQATADGKACNPFDIECGSLRDGKHQLTLKQQATLKQQCEAIRAAYDDALD